MVISKPRINITVEEPMYNTIKELAERDGKSVASATIELLKNSIEIHEDKYWLEKAEKREKNFNHKKSLTHKQVWD